MKPRLRLHVRNVYVSGRYLAVWRVGDVGPWFQDCERAVACKKPGGVIPIDSLATLVQWAPREPAVIPLIFETTRP